MKRKQLLLTAMMFSTSMVAAELPINNLLAESPEDRQEINLLIEQIKSSITEKKSFFYDKSPNFKGLSLGVNAGDIAKLAITKTGKVNNDYIISQLSRKDLQTLQKELSSMTANTLNYVRRKNLDYTKNTINKALVDAKSIKNIFRSSAKSSAKNTLKPICSPLITTTIGPNIEIDLNNSISLKSNLSRSKSKPFIDLDSFVTTINHDTQVGNDNVSLGIGLGINYQKNNDFSKYNYLSIRPDNPNMGAFKHFNNKKNINDNAEFLVVSSGKDRGQWLAPDLIVGPSEYYVDSNNNKTVPYGPEDHLMFVYRTKITNIINSISLITGPTITSKQFTINVFNKLWISLNLNLFIKLIIKPFYIFSSIKQFITIKDDKNQIAHYKETKLPLAFDCDFSINNLLVKLI